MVRAKLKHFLYVLIVVLSLYTLHLTVLSKFKTYRRGRVQKTLIYDSNTPFIFLGGVSFAEWSPLNAMLDRHPEIRCGPAIWLNSFLVHHRMKWNTSKEEQRLRAGGVTDEMVDSAVAAFILEIIVKRGEPAPHLCVNDPFSLVFSIYLSQLFPRAKFLLVLRNISMVPDSFGLKAENNVVVGQVLKFWNILVNLMYQQCLVLGSDRCLPVSNEQLESHPRKVLEQILIFLEVSWHESVLGEMNLMGSWVEVNTSRQGPSVIDLISQFGQVIFQDLSRGWTEGVKSNNSFS